MINRCPVLLQATAIHWIADFGLIAQVCDARNDEVCCRYLAPKITMTKDSFCEKPML